MKNNAIIMYFVILAIAAVVSHGWANVGVSDCATNFAGFTATVALYFALVNGERLSKIDPTESEQRTKVTWKNDWDNDAS